MQLDFLSTEQFAVAGLFYSVVGLHIDLFSHTTTIHKEVITEYQKALVHLKILCDGLLGFDRFLLDGSY